MSDTQEKFRVWFKVTETEVATAVAEGVLSKMRKNKRRSRPRLWISFVIQRVFYLLA